MKKGFAAAALALLLSRPLMALELAPLEPVVKQSEYDRMRGEMEKKVRSLEKKLADCEKRPIVWKEKVTGMKFVVVKGGCYQMGCGHWTSDCDDDEKSVHQVCVDDFSIGQYEVTQGEWQKIFQQNPSRFQKGDNYPVERVNWFEAAAFANELSRRNGLGRIWSVIWRGSKGRTAGASGCPPRRSGSMRLAVAAGRSDMPAGMMWIRRPGILAMQRAIPIRWERDGKTTLGCMTCPAMCGSGVRTGMMKIITGRYPSRLITRRGRKLVRPACFAAAGTALPGRGRSASSSPWHWGAIGFLTRIVTGQGKKLTHGQQKPTTIIREPVSYFSVMV